MISWSGLRSVALAFSLAVAALPALAAPKISVELDDGTVLTSGTGIMRLQEDSQRTGPARFLLVRNVGNSTLSLSPYTVIGTNPNDFHPSGADYGASLAPGGSATITITFVSGGIGNRSATLRIPSNDADANPFLVQLKNKDAARILPVISGFEVDAAYGLDQWTIDMPCTAFRSVAVDAAGNLYARHGAVSAGGLSSSTWDGGLFKRTPSGEVTLLHSESTFASFEQFPQEALPGDLAVNAAGRLYFFTPNHNNFQYGVDDGIYTLEPGQINLGSSPQTLPKFADLPGGGRPMPLGGPATTVDSGGNFWMVDTNAVKRVTPAGAITTVATFPISQAGGIAVDSSGNAYITVISSTAYPMGSLVKVTSAGTVSVVTSGTLGIPQGVTIGGDGSLYVCNYRDYLIQRVSLSGSVFTLCRIGQRYNRPTGIVAAGNNGLFVAVGGNRDNTGAADLGYVAQVYVVPFITDVSAPAAAYRPGQVIRFRVPFATPVTRGGTGNPSLAITVGGVNRSATFDAATSNANELFFDYTVQAGDASGAVASVSPLVLGTATLKDPQNFDALIDFTAAALPGVTTDAAVANTAPVITSNGGGATASINVPEGTTAVTTVTATDAEVPATQTLTYSKSGADAALFTLNPTSGALSFTTARDFETPTDANSDGIYEVTVTVTDNATPTPASDSQALSITVTNVNEMPSFTKGVDQTKPYGTSTAQSVSGWATAINDGDSTVTQALTFNITGNTNTGLFTTRPAISSTGTLTYTPTGAAGTATISVTLSDDASINGNAALTTAAQTFTITVSPPSTNAALTGLALSGVTFAPPFASGTFAYTASVPNATTALTVTPTKADANATIKVQGVTVASGSASSSIPLSPGPNTITTEVTAQDGTTKQTYTVTVTRASSLAPDIAVVQTSSVADGGSIDFGTVTVGSSSAAKTFTITNPGNADLTSLAVSKDGTNASDFTVSALSGTTVPVGSGSVTFTVTFTPSASGTRGAALHIASNVSGAKNPYDIVLTGTAQTAFQAWAASNSVPNDPNALGNNGVKNLLNFAFNVNPTTAGGGALAYTGTFGGPLVTTPITTGQQSTRMEPSAGGVDFRGLFVRRKDATSAGLTYTPQFSADMITWQDSTATPVVLADDGVNQIVSVPYPVFIAGKKARFFRISVTINP
jgi:Cadherin-like beta sandwich domain/Abnormal spindle-like microcephaly-assoc'd, ASPM-SPD-2-Hydin/Cadherin domain